MYVLAVRFVEGIWFDEVLLIGFQLGIIQQERRVVQLSEEKNSWYCQCWNYSCLASFLLLSLLLPKVIFSFYYSSSILPCKPCWFFTPLVFVFLKKNPEELSYLFYVMIHMRPRFPFCSGLVFTKLQCIKKKCIVCLFFMSIHLEKQYSLETFKMFFFFVFLVLSICRIHAREAIWP